MTFNKFNYLDIHGIDLDAAQAKGCANDDFLGYEDEDDEG